MMSFSFGIIIIIFILSFIEYKILNNCDLLYGENRNNTDIQVLELSNRAILWVSGSGVWIFSGEILVKLHVPAFFISIFLIFIFPVLIAWLFGGISINKPENIELFNKEETELEIQQ